MIDTTKPMKFVCENNVQVTKVVNELVKLGYTLLNDFGDGTTVFAYVSTKTGYDKLAYDIASHDVWRHASGIPFEAVDAETFVAQHTKPVGREITIEEALEMFVEAGATMGENGSVVFSTGDFFDAPPPREPIKWPVNASDILQEAAEALNNRAAERDHGKGDERSMERCVASFNAMRGKDLSVEDGWLFMVFLKLARSSNGAFREDDYIDMAAYCALAGEEASK